MNNTPKPRCRLFRYSLRTLLLLVALASVGFGWLGLHMRQVQRRATAVEAVVKAGGQVMYDYEVDSIGELIPSATPHVPTWVENSLGVDFYADVVLVDFSYARISGADLANLREFGKLRRLNLFFTNISDRELLHLHGSRQLSDLDVRGTQVTDAGCKELQNALPNLKILQ